MKLDIIIVTFYQVTFILEVGYRGPFLGAIFKKGSSPPKNFDFRLNKEKITKNYSLRMYIGRNPSQ